MTSFSKICNRIIEFSFYALLFLVPLSFSSKTSELFELNKMWFTFALTIVIGASWFIKSIVNKEFRIQKTPLDIPILIFLFSQIISTIFSIDRHISIWGYYSRFNGGLLSILSYIFLYYAFISNLSHLGKLLVKRVVLISLASGAIVALWGFPSHFGYDPTCLLFRGTFDVSCWTDAFQPKVRIFSTLGQPDWLGAYLAILLPLSIAFFIQKTQNQALLGQTEQKIRKSDNLNIRISDSPIIRVFRVFRNPYAICYLLLTTLFYVDLLWTKSRSVFIAFWVSFIFLIASIIHLNKKTIVKNLSPITNHLSLVLILILSVTFIVGTPLSQLDKLTLNGIRNSFAPKKVVKEVQGPKNNIVKEVGGTHSGKIRLIVWEGAIKAWLKNPVFGTGVETFAFAYYQFRPQEHNMVSEWDYLYNKAHNEYLNYLTTTGIFGLGSYLALIGWFLFVVLKKLKNQNSKIIPIKSGQNSKLDKEKLLALNCNFELLTLNFALIASYISILVSNFFGFSVVIVNIYFFLIPAFVLLLTNSLDSQKTFSISFCSKNQNVKEANYFQWLLIIGVSLFSLYFLFTLYKFRSADTSYALGSNLDKVGQYQEGYLKLKEAVKQRSDEPVFKDELSINEAVLAGAYAQEKDATGAAETAVKLAEEAINLNTENITKYPNNLIFWKTRARLFYALSQGNAEYLKYALEALIVANKLAPTDAKIAYNLGVLYGQTGDKTKAIEVLKLTTKLKPDYRDAFYALGLFYHELAINQNEVVIKPEYQNKAIEQMNYILNNLSSEDTQAKENLKKWGN